MPCASRVTNSVASTKYAGELSAALNVTVSPLLQCTDPELFNPEVEKLDPAPRLALGAQRQQHHVGVPTSRHGDELVYVAHARHRRTDAVESLSQRFADTGARVENQDHFVAHRNVS